MTPYNLAASVGRALDAGALHLLDSEGTGTITVAPKGVGILVCNVAGDRTLQAAAGVDLGASVKVYATVASVTVNAQAIADGGFAEFQVTLNASGAHQWTLTTLQPATIPTITGDTSAYVEATIVGIVNALAGAGIAINGTTT